jgi:hypothetical protein
MQSTPDVPRLIGVSGAAKTLGKSQKTVRRWITAGTLTAAGRIGNGHPNDPILLLHDEVEALAAQLKASA